MKIPIIRKGEYDIWSMRMRQYICHTDHNLWDVIVNGDQEEEPVPTGETSAPKTTKQLAAKRNQERVKSILLLAIPDEYLLKFHNVVDAKSLWAAIKSRFKGNEESKKMQKNVLKHQFENFTTASNESLNNAYDRFQKLMRQLEVHGAPISKEDINQKFLRSLPPSWNQIALIMRNKPDIDEIDIDDLYNNLRNLAFLSSENTSSTNEVSTASGDFGRALSFAQPATSPQLENEDFQQIDEDHLEELDLRWQVAMLTVRVKKFIQKTGRNLDFKEKQPVSLDKSGRNQGRRSYGDNGRSNAPTNESSSQALVAQDGLGGYDWSNNFEVEPVNYALMAISSSRSSSSSDNKISLSVFYVRSSDEENTPANDRFSKADGFHAVPPPITKNFLTPRVGISFAGKTNEANTQKPKTVYESVNRDKVIIEDWNSDDEDDVSEVQTVSPVKTNETQTSQEPKLKTVVNTGPRVDKPVWDNTKRVNHQKISKYPHLRKTFVPSGVLTRTGLITPVKQNEKRAVHTVSTARPVSTVRPVSIARPVSTVRPFATKITQIGGAIRLIYPRIDNVRPRGSYSPIKRAVVNTGKGKMDTDLKKLRWVWRPKGNYLDHVSKDSGSFTLKKFEYVDLIRSGYHQKDRKPSQNDKTEHGMEKTVQNQGQSPKMPKSESILKNQQSLKR
ncbi:hypothetical protein Tco_0490296 [Tanacetum coccineum]